MGQAKARGSLEQRIEQAKAKAQQKAEDFELERKLSIRREREAEAKRLASLPEEARREVVFTGGLRPGRSLRNNLMLSAALSVAAMSTSI